MSTVIRLILLSQTKNKSKDKRDRVFVRFISSATFISHVAPEFSWESSQRREIATLHPGRVAVSIDRSPILITRENMPYLVQNSMMRAKLSASHKNIDAIVTLKNVFIICIATLPIKCTSCERHNFPRDFPICELCSWFRDLKG